MDGNHIRAVAIIRGTTEKGILALVQGINPDVVLLIDEHLIDAILVTDSLDDCGIGVAAFHNLFKGVHALAVVFDVAAVMNHGLNLVPTKTFNQKKGFTAEFFLDFR